MVAGWYLNNQSAARMQTYLQHEPDLMLHCRLPALVYGQRS